MQVVNKALQGLNLSKKSSDLPKEPDLQQLEELKKNYAKAGQEHVLQFYDQLDTASKSTLYEQLTRIPDPEYVNKIAQAALKPPGNNDTEAKPQLAPLPEAASASVLDTASESLEQWHKHGLELIAENQVAVVLMAGGQGTRLGSSAPKGCYNIGLPSQKSLFQLQAERILKVQEMARQAHNQDKVVIPWYVMTSGPTRRPTEQFFDDHKYFGLDKADVLFFEQGVLPCISNDGKILLEDKSKVAVAPDGNGGIYQAMVKEAVIANMEKRGIKHVHAYCVDNCLVRVADPTFIGFAASKQVDIATKVVRKRNAKESVGLILQKNGKPDVVEYSEIDAATAEAKDTKNPELLEFRAANIVNHYYSFGFLQSIPQWYHKLPHHVARKKIPYFDLEKQQAVKPEKPNGVKLEQFVFDCFPLLAMDKFACLEVRREDEFSPLKNAKGTGEDDEDTSRAHIMEQGRRFLEAAGAVVTSESSTTGVEVSPLISYAGEGLEFLKGKELAAPAVVEKE